MRMWPALSRCLTVTRTFVLWSFFRSRYLFSDRRSFTCAVARAGIANLVDPSIRRRLALAVVSLTTPLQRLVLPQCMVTGATRFLVTVIGRLEMCTNDLPTLVGSVLGCEEGGGVFVTGGRAVVSIVNAVLAGDASTLPARSVARTPKVCDPSLSELETHGDVHGWNACASTLHSKVALGSSDEKANFAAGLFEGLGGAVSIVVSGGVRSTVHA
jgi:hypothetical protein